MAFKPAPNNPGDATELQYLPTVHVHGFGNLGKFDKFSGGDVTANIVKYRPGGMGNEQTFLGLPVFADVTVERAYIEQRDHKLIAELHPLVGRYFATVTLQPLDSAGNPFGQARSYHGRLASIMDGSTDSTSNAVRMWQLHVSVEDIAH